ncbi:D-alanine transaminase [Rhizobiales bacterium GAS191]|nr:D-alanine transaminase [Rhizobiales bacterium GAS113]SEC21787.1 D-alanine transaminase [Rhizobiales bacterium GAS191]SED00991.1 D-alanine transaminase [Rhizobiales bacterium GAS188]
MSRIVYVNGAFVPEAEAKISIFDRGFIFADGIYEVSAVLDGGLVDNDAHLARLERSLGEIHLAMPCSKAEIVKVQKELISRNRLVEGSIYLQVTRGAADREFAFPADAKPSLVMFTQARVMVDDPKSVSGIKLHAVADIRWARRDIKSVALLAQVLAKQAAAAAGCQEAIMHEDGVVTEGGSSTVFIVTEEGRIVTRPNSNAILPGITRQSVIRLAREKELAIEERLFTLDEVFAAQECFVTSATSFVKAVVEVDGRRIGGGQPGPVVRRLRDIYIEAARQEARANSAL